MVKSFLTVTETPGMGATRDQIAMLYSRYRFAATFCEGKDILEVACGCGQGLGYLSKKGKGVIGGDYTENLLSTANATYKGGIPLLSLDAHSLPFQAESFDVIILFEAIYYLSDPGLFIEECRRVLRKNGIVFICTVNKEWKDFNPSPFSTQYFSAYELSNLLEKYHFDVQILGAFPVVKESIKDHIVSFLKRSAISLGLMPKTMRGKELLKRIFLGELKPFPSEVQEGMADYTSPTPIPNGANSNYKVIYAVSHLQ